MNNLAKESCRVSRDHSSSTQQRQSSGTRDIKRLRLSICAREFISDELYIQEIKPQFKEVVYRHTACMKYQSEQSRHIRMELQIQFCRIERESQRMFPFQCTATHSCINECPSTAIIPYTIFLVAFSLGEYNKILFQMLQLSRFIQFHNSATSINVQQSSNFKETADSHAIQYDSNIGVQTLYLQRQHTYNTHSH